ncbi:uncharacterized protein BCR38DRAFT_488299 [Pseudomassariella vexata]|uniref:Uncharacterized protein n=1 Tax=Pseudomassariella vexata TaxID=1141098 RepID=A0A1Y2DLH2_9PEZI|nr:uncharacterized protein BCR38DRAFT_488299 [Pseudomassariella vexata]ORY60113.1 hypothetical protein BCR38DRAFT_488299 [Pseudomassariella vexata]
MPAAAPSLMTTPMHQGTVDLDDLEVEDTDTEDERKDTRDSSTSTLDLLKTKLSRRLSQRSDARRSQHGSSEEEIARRAELKRLMHKRIQEELESEKEAESKHDDSSLIGPRDALEFVIYNEETSIKQQVPSSPQLEPVHVPSGSVGSWRLSTQIPPDNLEEPPDPEGEGTTGTQPHNKPDYPPPIEDKSKTDLQHQHDSSADQYSPLDMWLCTQDLLPEVQSRLDAGALQIGEAAGNAGAIRNAVITLHTEHTPDTKHSVSSHYTIEENSENAPPIAISETSSYRTAPIQAPTPEGIIAVHEPQRPTSAVSETLSFKVREVELESVAKRFVMSNLRRDPSGPVASRFREEFDEPLKVTKPSILAKFHLAKPKKGKVLVKIPEASRQHRNCVTDALEASHLAAAGPNADIARPRAVSGPIKQPIIVESTTGLWKRAVRLEADRREAKQRENKASRKSRHFSSDTGHPSSTHGHSNHNHQHQLADNVSRHRNHSGWQSPRSGLAIRPDDANIGIRDDSVGTSNSTLKEWQRQIQSEETAFERTPSFATRLFTPQKSRTPPSSWAKWPSHTRVQRTGSANQRDIVTPKDFAVTDIDAGGATKWFTDNNRASPVDVREPKHVSQSFTDKFGRALRCSIAKLMKPGSDMKDENPSESRKSTGYLEYPELELLPLQGGYKEIQALEQQIGNIKRPSVVTESQRCCSAPAKTPLSVRLAQKVHEIQHGDRTNTAEPDIQDFLGTPPPQPPVTPDQRHSTPQAHSAPTAPFATPMSHVSYDDCVQKHLLDENDSVKSDTTVMVKRSKSNVERSVPSQTKYKTWNGRAKTQPVLLKSTREFGAELDKMLASEKGNVMIDVSPKVKILTLHIAMDAAEKAIDGARELKDGLTNGGEMVLDPHVKETDTAELYIGMKDAEKALDGARELEMTLKAGMKAVDTAA